MILIPIKANAEEVSVKLYKYDTYTIKYEVANEWENSQNISIVVTNTSNEPIENWMLSYDFFC